MRCALLIPLCERRNGKNTLPAGSVNVGLATEPAEDGEGVGAARLVDQLAAGLDLAVEPGGQRVRVLAGRSADDEVLETAFGLVPLRLETVGEIPRLLPRRAFDAHLPRRKAAFELFFLPRLARRLVVPPILLVEPVLDPARPCLDPALGELGLDHLVGLLRFGASVGIDEESVVVARDREAPLLQLLGQLARLRAELACQPLEQPRGVLLFLDLNTDAPVVFGHVLSSLVCAGGLARAVRARGGAVLGGGGPRARRAATGAARERGVGCRAVAVGGRRPRRSRRVAPKVGCAISGELGRRGGDRPLG